jgi:hypothetical protein
MYTQPTPSTELLQTAAHANTSLAVTFDFLNTWHCVLPENGKHVPKHVGEAGLVFVLSKKVPLVDIIHGVYKYSLSAI